MYRREAIKALGLTGIFSVGMASKLLAGTLDSPSPKPPIQKKPRQINFRNSPQFIISDTDTPRHIIDFYWSATCKYSAITATQTIIPVITDPAYSNIAARFTLIPRYKQEVPMGALMLSVAPRVYWALCLQVLNTAFHSANGFLTINEVAALAKKAGASEFGSEGYDGAQARGSLELATHYYRKVLKQTETPTVYVDGRKISIRDDNASAEQLKGSLT